MKRVLTDLEKYLIEQIFAFEAEEFANVSHEEQRRIVARIEARKSFYGGERYWDPEKYPVTVE